jgi:regulator of sigma E protease
MSDQPLREANTSLPDMEKSQFTEVQLSAAAAELGISETEYRLNWIPLGGYVKMLGQDDLKPGQIVSDPRSYNNKTIGQRMVIVSAGVIMNVILAAFGFVYIYTVGIERVHPTAGLIIPGSPAQHTYKTANNLPTGSQTPMPIQVGDTILAINGRDVVDFDKLRLYTMLSIPGETIPLDVRHADGRTDRLWVTPLKDSPGAEFPSIGMGSTRLLKAPPVDIADNQAAPLTGEEATFKPGDVITAVDKVPVQPNDYDVLDQHLQHAAGKPIEVTITNAAGATRTATLNPHLSFRFGDDRPTFAGMQMLNSVDSVRADSTLSGKLQPGDLIVNIADPGASGGQWGFPTFDRMVEEFNSAGERKISLDLTVRRNGQLVPLAAVPTYKNPVTGKYGFGLSVLPADGDPIIANDLIKGSPADLAGVRGGSTIVSINGSPVHNWFDVKNLMSRLKPGEPVQLVASFDNTPKTYTLQGLTRDQIDEIASNGLVCYAVDDLLADSFPLKANNLWGAFKMGIAETRDAILQVYLTVRSMTRGGVSPKELSGPVGILSMGYLVASKGITHLVWFLSIISANLAVMNFLPIPIVDGGLFTFLIIEKIKGSPLSQRTQAIAQVVGLALLLSVFVFATFQDVSRLPLLFGKN